MITSDRKVRRRTFSCGARLLLVLCLVVSFTIELRAAAGSLEPARISPAEAYDRVKSGRAILVCSYEDEAACGKILLEGAITLKRLEGRIEELKRDQPIVFYCA